MAQALYDEHPLDKYLRESGDIPEYVPGAFPDASDEESEGGDVGLVQQLVLSSPTATRAVQAFRRSISSFQSLSPLSCDDLAERFRYDLISSGLLASSIPSTPTVARPHSRLSSSSPICRVPGELAQQVEPVEKSEQGTKTFSGTVLCAALVALLSQYRLFSVLLMVASFVLSGSKNVVVHRRKHSVQVFEFLDGLKNAASAWDAAVNDATTILAAEERNSRLATSSASYAPSSSLRIALHSTLITTQHHCDNVRPLLAALSSPAELSQLSEMYAPPSPRLQTFSLQSRISTPVRKHLSLPESTSEGSSIPRTPSSDKRSSWAGSTAPGSLSCPPSLVKKWDRRRSDVSTFRRVRSPPASTSPISPSLAQVLEANEGVEDDDSVELPFDEADLPKDNFGTAALHLRRKRRISSFEALGLSSPRSDPSLRNSLHGSSLSSLSPSRFTSMSTSRHPLSPSALDQALQAAVASRRYACAHLLALRFKEDADDELYWDNVRSVTELLTTTLQDTANRLNEALAEADDISRQEGEPTPEGSPKTSTSDRLFVSLQSSDSESGSFLPPLPKSSVILDFPMPPLPVKDASFAPVPSSLMRFVSHMDAISSSLSDAKGYLADSVEELKEFQRSAVPASPEGSSDAKATEESVMQAYDRLRRELGIALREYERGRAALIDVFESRRVQAQSHYDSGEENEGVPSPGRTRRDTDSGSSGDSQDKIDIGPLTPGEGSPLMPSFRSLHLVTEIGSANQGDRDGLDDDATQHLLIGASSSHLPSPGVEQVFEDESAAAAFTRERSKLSREERIKLMKAKRESMSGRGLAAQLDDEQNGTELPAGGRWGPSTDVVEELKDVIWKVGERRRKMTGHNTRQRRASIIPIPVQTATEPDYETSLSTT